MLEWIRNKFASAIGFFFVLAVILCAISGRICGEVIGKQNIGLVIGFFLGIIGGILSFGFIHKTNSPKMFLPVPMKRVRQKIRALQPFGYAQNAVNQIQSEQ